MQSKDYIVDEAGNRRCRWCGKDPVYVDYHDKEWGKEAFDDGSQFEFLVLESAQAGLSWITILRKREAYRRAYSGFDAEKVSRYSEKDVERLMANPGIVRNRQKIESSIVNARLFLEISALHGSFANWLLSFYDGVPRKNKRESMAEIPASTPESEAIAREMKKFGFRFFGPVIAYAHLQATGIVNDHLSGCCSY